MSKADRAEELFRMGYNCSQTVFAAFADEIGMTVEDAAKLASPFGAGFGKLREVCGAVSGMTMLAGLKKGYSDPTDSEGKKALYKLEQEMCAEFEAKCGSIICRDLLNLKPGEDLPEPAVRTEEYYQSRPCIGACRAAAEIAEKYLFADDGKTLKLKVTYSFPDKDKRDGFYQALRNNKIDTISQAEDGCIQYDYVVPEDSDTTLLLFEEWESKEHQQTHLKGQHLAFVGGFKVRFKAETTLEEI